MTLCHKVLSPQYMGGCPFLIRGKFLELAKITLEVSLGAYVFSDSVL